MSLGSRFYRQKGRVTMDENELMGSMKVSKAVAKMAIPSVISSLVTVVYNMADTFFVGQTGDPLQVAAVSLTNPIFILFMAFANMFGMGGSAAASMALGEKKEKRVKQVSSFITYASLIVGIVFAAILLVGMQPVLQLFGADADTYELAKGYTTYISYGAPFIIWSAAASFVVRADGASREAMTGSMIGTVANIILDPIFISGFGMGAAGAAIATTIGNIMASVYYLWYFCRKSRNMSMAFRYFKCGDRILSQVCSAGLPTAIFSALMSISTIILNQILVAYGNAPVAAIGIVFKANMFITFLQMGLANGVQPLLGYSYGAGNRERFITVERYTKKCCLIVGVLATALFFFFRYRGHKLWCGNADCLYDFRSGHWHFIYEYELYAVYRKCTSGNDSFYIETGRTFDSGALRLECIARSARCYLRTGIDGLCGSSPFYCNLALETQENFIGENGQVAFFTGWC